MKYCDKCKVKVRGSDELCPLCRNTLSGDAEPDGSLYPVVRTLYGQHKLLFQLMLLGSVAAAVISVAVNIMVGGEHGWWSVFVVLGIGCSWIILALALNRMHCIPKYIASQVAVLILLGAVWDYMTGWRGWSLDFVLPCASIAAMLSLAIVSKVMRMPPGDYVVYLLLSVLFGAIPAVLAAFGLIKIMLPTVVCVSCGIVTMAALVIFEGKNMCAELVRRFHM